MAIRHRLFFALLPTGPVRKSVALHRDRLEDLRSPVAVARLHLTLAVTALYDEFPAEVVHALHKLASGVMCEPVAISLERIAVSAGSAALRPAGRFCRELRVLQNALAAPMADQDVLLPGYRFRPHVTLGYRRGDKSLVAAIEPIAWHSDEFVLIHSEHGATRYTPLGRWPLRWRQGRLF